MTKFDLAVQAFAARLANVKTRTDWKRAYHAYRFARHLQAVARNH